MQRLIPMLLGLLLCTIAHAAEPDAKTLETGFLKVAQAHVKATRADRVEPMNDGYVWAKNTYTESKATYDIRKSDSVLYPYTATYTLPGIYWRSDIYATEAAAKSAPPAVMKLYTFTFTYGWRDGQWVLRDTKTTPRKA